MARQAQFRNSLFWLLLLTACQQPSPPDRPIPDVTVAATNPELKGSGGVLRLGNKAFSGWLIELYPAGDTALLSSYSNGREEGLSRRWYADGRLQEERFYTAGRKEGVHCGWWPDGTPRFRYHFNGDEYEGEVAEWFRDGQLAKKFHYRAGHEDGRQQLWWEGGKVRANYVVKDGQQYGLIGRKLCQNIFHEKKG